MDVRIAITNNQKLIVTFKVIMLPIGQNHTIVTTVTQSLLQQRSEIVTNVINILESTNLSVPSVISVFLTKFPSKTILKEFIDYQALRSISIITRTTLLMRLLTQLLESCKIKHMVKAEGPSHLMVSFFV